MKKSLWLIVLACWPLLLFAPAASGADEPVKVKLTDERVDTAIQKAISFLKSKRNDLGNWEPNQNDTGDRFWTGDTGLALLALLYAGEDPREEAMSRSLEWYNSQPLRATYTYGTRAHVLALVPGRKFRSRLQDDLTWLLTAIWAGGDPGAGAYDYEMPPAGTREGSWDNSNSQYGVLGAWMATDAGLTAPETYWRAVADHWLRTQNTDGGWGYRAKEASTGSMSAAGLATLYVVLDRLYAEQPKSAAGVLPGIDGGLNWFGRNFATDNPNGSSMWKYYYLYGVERVGRASGQKYFRDKDWFRLGAEELLRTQEGDGSWGHTGEGMSDVRNTAFALMFLCHGRAPMMFNKLEHGNDWNSKLRDVSGLQHYSSRVLERLLNWQIVRLDGKLEDLLEAPVLYLTGDGARKFSEVDIEKISTYCRRGGMLFAVPGRDNRDFFKSIEELARKAFPDYPLRPIIDDHPLFNGKVQFEIKDPPLFYEVNNGIRTLLLLCSNDISEAWNRGQARGEGERNLQIGTNVYLYATDKSAIRSRLQSPIITPEPVTAERTIAIARIKYDGAWDLEPFGWTRLTAYLNNEAKTKLLLTSGIRLDAPELLEFPVAFMTGTEAFKLSPPEQEGLKKFLSKGGTLLADAGNGSKTFLDSFEQMIREVTREEPKFLPADSAFMKGVGIPGGVDLNGIGYRRTARGEVAGQNTPRLKVIDNKRRYSVIYAPMDLSVGLLGTQVFGLRGYDADGPLRIMRNMILYGSMSTAQKARIAGEASK